MSFPQYEKYKGSGVDWLGEVPEHWSVEPLKVGASFNDEVLSETTDPDYEIQYVDIGSVSLEAGIVTMESLRFGDAPSRARRKTRTGDVLVSTVRTYLKAIAPVTSAPENLIASTGFAVVRPRENLYPGFAKYVLQSHGFVDEVIARSNGVSYPAINSSDLCRISIPRVPMTEQLFIANFLDQETAKIDALAEEQRRLIELLKEKRQAVISHAVTKGFNPDAPMKDSGIEWLGQIPTTWIANKLGRTSFMQEGPGLRHWQFTGEGTRVICVTNITEYGIDFSRLEKFISNDEYNSIYSHFTVQRGDILLSSSGNSWGKVAIYDGSERVILNTSTIRLNESEGSPLNRDFLALMLQSDTVREQLGLAMTGSCQPNFGPTHLKGVMVAVPPRGEQAAIIAFVIREIEKIDALTAKANSAIDLLQERRTTLISAAVVGKIDVRGLVKEEAA
jgi:type I restriction enzyme S subunit